MRRLAAALLLLAAPGMTEARAQGAGERTLTIATHYTEDQRRPLTACFREYEAAHPGLRIVHQQSEISDYLQTVMTARIAGTSPDIYNVYSLWSDQLAEAEMLDAPPPALAQEIAHAYAPNTLAAVRVADKVWGYPAEVSVFMLIYNRKLLAEAGAAAPPRSWDELAAIAAKITRKNAQGTITRAGYAFGPTVANGVYPFEALLQSRGVAPFKPDLSGTNLASPAAVEVLAAQARLFATGVTSDAVQVRDFPSGAVGMMIFANWYKNTLRQAFGPAFLDTVGVAPIPAGPDWRTLQYAFFLGVDAKSRHRDEAWALLRWLNAPHGASGRSCVGDMLVTMGALTGNLADIAASRDELGDDFSRPYVEAISSGRAVSDPNMPHASEIQGVLRDAIGRAWSGTQPAAAALKAADARITEILSDSR